MIKKGFLGAIRGKIEQGDKVNPPDISTAPAPEKPDGTPVRVSKFAIQFGKRLRGSAAAGSGEVVRGEQDWTERFSNPSVVDPHGWRR